MKIGIKSLLDSLGFDRVREINKYDYKNAHKIFREEIDYNGLSILMLLILDIIIKI
jgi:indolepyruvate ferredoxin oxidoreductase, alpha subunit